MSEKITYTNTEGNKFSIERVDVFGEFLQDGIKLTRTNLFGQIVSKVFVADLILEKKIIDWLLLQRSERPAAQQVFPFMTPEEREFFITGLAGEDWDEMIPEDSVFPSMD